MRNVIIDGSDITAVMHVELTKEMVRAIEKRPFQLKGLLKDLHATDGVICTDKDQNPIFEMSIRMPNVFTMQREMTGFEMREQQFIQEISKWVKKDAAKMEKEVSKTMKRIWEETHKKAKMPYIHISKTEKGYIVSGNMSVSQIAEAIGQAMMYYADTQKQPE